MENLTSRIQRDTTTKWQHRALHKFGRKCLLTQVSYFPVFVEMSNGQAYHESRELVTHNKKPSMKTSHVCCAQIG